MIAATLAPRLDGALCVGPHADLFLPGPGRSDLARKAKAICAWCPVRQACLEWALSDPRLVGVLGGTTYVERCFMAGWKGRRRPDGSRRKENGDG